MTQAAFDTFSTARRLHEEFDFLQKQAEGAARLVYEHLAGTVATKEDFKALKAKMATKADLKAEIADSKAELIKWIVGMQLGGIAIIVTLVVGLLQILPRPSRLRPTALAAAPGVLYERWAKAYPTIGARERWGDWRNLRHHWP